MNLESLMSAAQSFFSSNAFSLFLQGLILYIAVLWIAIIVWVTRDVNNRSNSLFFQVFSILIVIFLTPLFGLLIYLILRPGKTLTEKYIEEMQMQLLAEAEEEERMKLAALQKGEVSALDEELASKKGKLKKVLSKQKDTEMKEEE